jgi:hypothetical protein
MVSRDGVPAAHVWTWAHMYYGGIRVLYGGVLLTDECPKVMHWGEL